jgi:hypothetical protein
VRKGDAVTDMQNDVEWTNRAKIRKKRWNQRGRMVSVEQQK